MGSEERPNNISRVETHVSPLKPGVEIVQFHPVGCDDFAVGALRFLVGSSEVDTPENRTVFPSERHRANRFERNVEKTCLLRELAAGRIVPRFTRIAHAAKGHIPPAGVDVFPIGSLVHDDLVSARDDRNVGAAMAKQRSSHLRPGDNAQHATVDVHFFDEFVPCVLQRSDLRVTLVQPPSASRISSSSASLSSNMRACIDWRGRFQVSAPVGRPWPSM